MKNVTFLILIALLSGCALFPSNESKSANAKTAGAMKTEQETTARAVFAEAKQILHSRTNANGTVELQMRSTTETSDSEKFDYSYTRSLPFLLTVGVGLLAIVAALTWALKLHKLAKQESLAYRAISETADAGLSGLTRIVNNVCATEKDDRVVSVLKSLDGEIRDVRGKVKAI